MGQFHHRGQALARPEGQRQCRISTSPFRKTTLAAVSVGPQLQHESVSPRDQFVDCLYFLRKRTDFIRAFYDDASAPFTERKRKIEDGEEPFAPQYTAESDEPAFLDEYMQADESLDVLGQMCISVLAASLQLYLKELVQDRGVGRPEDDEVAKKAQGWINRYRVFFRNKVGIDWGGGPSNLAVLEEIVLARNRVQHPESITSLGFEQSDKDAAKYPRSFFADPLFEPQAFARDDSPDAEPVRPVRLKVTRDKLFAALNEVDAFSEWLDAQL